MQFAANGSANDCQKTRHSFSRDCATMVNMAASVEYRRSGKCCRALNAQNAATFCWALASPQCRRGFAVAPIAASTYEKDCTFHKNKLNDFEQERSLNSDEACLMCPVLSNGEMLVLVLR